MLVIMLVTIYVCMCELGNFRPSNQIWASQATQWSWEECECSRYGCQGQPGSNGSTRREAVNCIFVCMYMLCRTLMMFTCIKVLRHYNSCKGRVEHVKYQLLEQTTGCWVGQSKQNRVGIMSKHREGVSLPPGWGWDRPISEVLQRIAAQVYMDVIQ
jgi:hypothetical protein